MNADTAYTVNLIQKGLTLFDNDAAGRRINVSKSGSAFDQDDTIAYGYNARSELTNAVASLDSGYRYAYDFDEIGNRESSSERGTNSVYTANSLNQYTGIDDFTPQFDDDGNQTLIKTATGVWSVIYNGENRPVLWSQGTNTIAMSYDRIGRRVTKNNQRFVYDGYLQIADSSGNVYVWDPTEKESTRPLVWINSHHTAYYTHDGNKSVSEAVVIRGASLLHYEYAPFGEIVMYSGNCYADNPWRFSSEYVDDDIGMVYYNCRHYDMMIGRWSTKDELPSIANKVEGLNLYCFSLNNPIGNVDLLGQNIYIKSRWQHQSICVDMWQLKPEFAECPDCRKKERYDKVGTYCVEFAWILGMFDLNFGGRKWLKWDSFVLPTGIQLTGMVIPDEESSKRGKIGPQKETTPCQDFVFMGKMARMIGMTALYSLGRHNCRMFAQKMFEEAPGKLIEE